MEKNEFRNIAKGLSMLSQLGLSFIMPMLICVLICYLLSSRFGLDSWIYLVGILFGLVSSCITAYKFYKIEKEKGIRETRKISASNRHK